MGNPMAHAAHSEEHHGHHAIPMAVLAKVFGALVLLTVVTVLTSQIDLGGLNVPLALAIAFTKAGLVLSFFMALKYDNKVNTLVFSVGALFVAVFLIFTLFDTAFRGDLENVDPQTIADQQRAEEALRARDPGAAPADTTQAAPADTTQAAPADTSQAAPADTTQAAPAAADTTQAGDAQGH